MNRRPLIAVVLLGALTTAGCGDDASTNASPTARPAISTGSDGIPVPSTLVAAMQYEVTHVSSGSVLGVMPLGGQPTKLQLTGNMAGSNTQLDTTTPGTGRAILRVVDGKTYLKADPAIWKLRGPGWLAKVGDNWGQLPAQQSPKDVSLKSLLDQMFVNYSMGTIDDDTTAITRTTTNGRPTYTLTEKSGGANTLVIAADGTALPVLLKTTGENATELQFSQWNTVKPITAPPNPVVLPLS